MSWLRDNDVHVETMIYIAKCFILTNHILLLGKFYIYSRRCQNSLPTLRGFIAKTRRVYNIEVYIAREKREAILRALPDWSVRIT